MKLLLTLSLLILAASLSFSAEQDELLPGSNEPNTSIIVSTAITPSAVTVSSLTPTRVDTALNSSLTTAIGANYKRASVQFQNLTSTNVYCGYSATLTTANGWLLSANTIYEWFVGKSVSIYCLGVETSALRVGGKGYK